MRPMNLVATLLAGLAITCVASGAEERPIVLKASHLFDSKSGRLTDGGVVVIQGDRKA